MEHVIYDSTNKQYFVRFVADNVGDLDVEWSTVKAEAQLFPNTPAADSVLTRLMTEYTVPSYIVLSIDPVDDVAKNFVELMWTLDISNNKQLAYVARSMNRDTLEALIEHLMVALAENYHEELSDLGNQHDIRDRVYLSCKVTGRPNSFLPEYIVGNESYGAEKVESKVLRGSFRRFIRRKLEDLENDMLAITDQR